MKEDFKMIAGAILGNNEQLRNRVLNNRDLADWTSAIIDLAHRSGFKTEFVKTYLFLLRG